MHPQSKGYQRLNKLYHRLIGRMRACEHAAQQALNLRVARSLDQITAVISERRLAAPLAGRFSGVLHLCSVAPKRPASGAAKRRFTDNSRRKYLSNPWAIPLLGSFAEGVITRIHVELLQPRVLFSVTPSGVETMVSAAGSMLTPAIAMTPAGNSVVVWGTGASGGEVLARRYDSSGNALAAPFQVDQNPAGAAPVPVVAVDTAGDFVVAWAKGGSLYFRLYNSAGSAITSDTLVTTNKKGSDAPALAMLPNGSFLLAWEGNESTTDPDGIYARQFSATGVASGAITLINTTTAAAQRTPVLASDPAGDFAMAWYDDSSKIIKAAYMPAGGTFSSELTVDPSGNNDEFPTISFLAGGTYVIGWDEHDGSNPGIIARRFSGTTAIDASPFMVSAGTNQTTATVAGRADGSFLFAWTANVAGGSPLNDGSGKGIFAQPYTSTASTDGAFFQVNTTTQNDQLTPAAVWMGNSAIIAWDSNAAGSVQGIDLQRYTTSGPANQAPVNTVPSSQTTYQNAGLTFSPANGNAISISDADADGGIEQLSLSVTHGTLSLSGTSGLTFTSGANASATMTFTGTLSAINAALSGLTYAPTSNYTGSDSLHVVSNDQGYTGGGGPQSASDSIAIGIVAPSGDIIPGAQTTQENTNLVFSPANQNQLNAASNWDTIQLSTTHGKLTLGQTSGLSFSSGNGTNNTSMQFSGSTAAMNAAMNGLTFVPASNYTGTAVISVTFINSGITLGLPGSQSHYTINVTVTAPPPAPNLPPAISLPATQIINENTPLTLTGSNSFIVSDIDGGGNVEQVTLNATSGTITVTNYSQVTITNGTGTNDSSVTFTGTLTDLNAALNGLVFTPATDFYGSGGLLISVDDLGNSGTGGAQIASATLAIHVLPPFAVTTTSDVSDGDTSSITALLINPGADGHISLREAITASNNTSGSNELDFNIPGSGVQTISVTSALPQITHALYINATTQPNYAGSPLVELDGRSAPFGTIGLAIAASNTIVRGLAVYGFSGNGIDVLPVGANGVTIQANYVGINAAGTAIYNGKGIVLANSSNDLVGGTDATERNVVSGNFYEGIYVFGSLSTNDTISGNYVGTDPTGNVAIANGRIGIFVDSASGNFIGSAVSGGGNLISGNSSYGIEIGGTSPANNVICNNYVGTNAAGTASLTNGNDGIYLNNAMSTTIGGTTSAARNVISGNINVANSADGIWIQNGSANIVQGNYIGVDALGAAALGNYHDGVNIQSSMNDVIGGISAGAANIIAFNAKGVSVSGSGATANSIRGNCISRNSTIGIDLGDDGITANTGSVNATLPNNGINYPVFTGVGLTGSTLLLQGYIGTAPNQSAFAGAAIDIFKSDNTLANGQSAVYLGTITADASGNFNTTMAVSGLSIGDAVTATATDAAGNTSEFSVNTTVQPVNQPPAITLPAAQSLGENASLRLSTTSGNAISISDDAVSNASEQVTLSIAGGSLTLSRTTGLTFGGGTSNGSNLLTFTGTLANINAALNGLTYVPAQDVTGALSLSVSVNDLGSSGAGGAKTTNAGLSLTVNPVAHAPTVTSTSTLGLTQSTSGLVITPSPLDGAAKAWYQIASITGGTLYQSDGVTVIANGQFITYAQGSAGLKFTPSSASGGSFTVQTSIVANTGGLVASPVTATIAVNGPANSVPGLQSINEDTPLVFSTANVNSISVSDAAVGAGSINVSLSASSGSVTLATHSGITITNGGDGQSTLTFSGTVAAVNAALDGLTFVPALHTYGGAGLGLASYDTQTTASAGVSIIVNRVVHTPTVASATTNENRQTGLIAITPNALDGASFYFQISNITNGSLFFADGVTPIHNGDFIPAAQGTAGLKFTPSQDSLDSGSFDVQASTSADDSGLGGAVVAARINVSPAPLPTPQLLANAGLVANTAVATQIAPTTLKAAESGASTAALTYTIITPPAQGQLVLNGQVLLTGGQFTQSDIEQGNLTYVASNTAASDSFTFVVTDANGAALPAAVYRIRTVGAPAVPQYTPLPSPTSTPPAFVPSSGPSTEISSESGAVSDSNSGTLQSDSSSTTTSTSSAQGTGSAPSRTLPVRNSSSSQTGPAVTPLLPRSASSASDLTQQKIAAAQRNNDFNLSITDGSADGANLKLALGPLENTISTNNALAALGTGNNSAVRFSTNTPAALSANSALWHDLDEMHEQMTSSRKVHVVAGAASLVSVGMSVAYFMWAVRAGSILSSLLSSMPAWKLVDPLPILDQMAGGFGGRGKGPGDDEDDETLESMVDAAPKIA